jgi:hypothetical protein
MKSSTWMRVALAVATLLAAGGAQAKSKNEKLCADLASFRTSLADLQQMGEQSTIKQVREAEENLYSTGRRIVKGAKHDKNASDLDAAIEDLRRTTQRMPEDTTLAAVQSTLEPKETAVRDAAQRFTETYCPQ